MRTFPFCSRNLGTALLCALTLPLFAQKARPEKLIETAKKQAQQSLPLLLEMLAIPNDAHHKDDMQKNIAWCEQAFKARKFSIKQLPTASLPLLLAQRNDKPSGKTVLFYLHVDGQPVDPKKWEQESPWKPVLKERDDQGKWQILPLEKLQGNIDPEWRIFARSSSDDKGPVVALLAALDALESLRMAPGYNVHVLLDFEEELGSPELPAAVSLYQNELKADALVILDGPAHLSNQPTLSFGARGIAEITLTLFGPKQPLHSGHYGNYAPNPALRLSQVLASMKDDQGRVTIPGFYDGIVLSENDKKTMALVPDNEGEIRKKTGIGKPDPLGENYQESLQYPSLNIRGMQAGYIGVQARTIIPSEAIAEIDIRTVPQSPGQRLVQLVRDHIEKLGYHIVDGVPTDKERVMYDKLIAFHAEVSYDAFQTPMDSPIGQWLNRALFKVHGQQPINIRMMGGSVPISPFVLATQVPAVAVPTVNADNNQHAENENLRLGNYFGAVISLLGILTETIEPRTKNQR